MKIKISLLLLFLLLLSPSLVEAQCAMCRAVVESEQGGKTAEGLNNGIVYLMSIPYILLAVLGFVIYRNLRS